MFSLNVKNNSGFILLFSYQEMEANIKEPISFFLFTEFQNIDGRWEDTSWRRNYFLSQVALYIFV